MPSSIRVIGLVACGLAAIPTSAAERIAVFDAELHDTSGEGLREDQQRRLILVTEELRRALSGSGRYEVVDTAPVRRRIESGPSLRSCGTCAPAAAAELGADLAMVTVVNKVSNLILSITLVQTEAGPQGGARRAVHSAEIRGNNDESWLRGLRWLLRNRVLAEPGR
jgi:hypothetical protein